MECLGQSGVNPAPPLYALLGLPVGEVSWQMNCPDLRGQPIEEFMHKPVRKAVFPVAGLGTRFLPATKAMPKEMLPIVDKPLIHYAVEEAKAAGIEEFFFVTSRGKSAIDDHFDRAFELEATLRERGKEDVLEELEARLPEPGQIAYTRQQTPLGLGHAVWCARSLVGDEPFAVLLADDLMVCEQPCLAQMVEAYACTGGNLAAIIEVPRVDTSRYGVLDVVSDDGRLVRARGVVEKPDPAEAPSTSTIIGRYIIQPEVFGHLSNAAPGSGGEIQLTDALGKLIEEGQAFHGLRFDGRRFDCGDKLGFLEATVALGLQHPELGSGLRKILSAYL
jgi:UTP--glucose-1-phosphate uridylyltransferase